MDIGYGIGCKLLPTLVRKAEPDKLWAAPWVGVKCSHRSDFRFGSGEIVWPGSGSKFVASGKFCTNLGPALNSEKAAQLYAL